MTAATVVMPSITLFITCVCTGALKGNFEVIYGGGTHDLGKALRSMQKWVSVTRVFVCQCAHRRKNMKRKTKLVVLSFSVRPSELIFPKLSFLLLPHELIYAFKCIYTKETWDLETLHSCKEWKTSWLPACPSLNPPRLICSSVQTWFWLSQWWTTCWTTCPVRIFSRRILFCFLQVFHSWFCFSVFVPGFPCCSSGNPETEAVKWNSATSSDFTVIFYYNFFPHILRHQKVICEWGPGGWFCCMFSQLFHWLKLNQWLQQHKNGSFPVCVQDYVQKVKVESITDLSWGAATLSAAVGSHLETIMVRLVAHTL